jgi:hypothetical protein
MALRALPPREEDDDDDDAACPKKREIDGGGRTGGRGKDNGLVRQIVQDEGDLASAYHVWGFDSFSRVAV